MFMEREIINGILKRVNTLEKQHEEFVDRFNSLCDCIGEVIKLDIDDKSDIADSLEEIETILDIHTKAISKLIGDFNKGRKERKKHASDQ